MLDINGKEIKVGDTVRTQQPSGGILSPAPAQIGVVVEYHLSWETRFDVALAIRYERKWNNKTIDCYILLDGKINEVINS